MQLLLKNGLHTTDLVWLTGLILLARWLLDTSLGRQALADSPLRRNSMPPYLPFVPMLLWYGPIAIIVSVVQKLTPNLPQWQGLLRDHIVMSIGASATIATMLFLAQTHFARGLKGFGLNVSSIAKDFFMAILNLWAVWPLILTAVTVTIYFAKLFTNQDYQMPQHQQLEMIAEYPQLPLRIMIVFVAVVIAPLLEEMMFRGFVQTTIRSYINIKNSAWPAIAASAAFFAVMHADAGHWPTLFVLGVCLGYSYEKSGSLLRPIFIHLLFNAVSITMVLYESGG